jgi:hypothetical protein
MKKNKKNKKQYFSHLMNAAPEKVVLGQYITPYQTDSGSSARGRWQNMNPMAEHKAQMAEREPNGRA